LPLLKFQPSYFDIAQQNRTKKQDTSHHNRNSAETKDVFYITCYKFHLQASEFKSHKRHYHRGRI